MLEPMNGRPAMRLEEAKGNPYASCGIAPTRSRRTAPSVGRMQQAKEGIQMKGLIREITLYLAAVDAFRAEGCEPRWRAGS
jgi:hypothetical protein